MARRILVIRETIILILGPPRARGSVVVVRRTLVRLLESSLLLNKAASVLVGTRMCGHLPLVHSAYVKRVV